MKKVRGKGIIKVSDLFLKYKQILKAPQGSVVSAFIEVVEDMFHITLKKHQCSYSPQTKTLSLQTSGMIKSEILLQKKKILTHMAEKLGEKSTPKEIL
jgi:hypothetical protein